MTIGIGGAGSKLATKLDRNATIINVSENELNKVEANKRILAAVHTSNGQFRGSRKNPEIGKDAYLSIKRELLAESKGNILFSSTGGGTGNGIASALLNDIANADYIAEADKVFFSFILPYAKLEPAEFVNNTIDFLENPLSNAIDSGNTGNIVLFTNRVKFEEKIAEDAYNEMLINSIKIFLAIPEKNERYKLLDGHIDFEDFSLYKSKPYFNHFTYFNYNPEINFGKQLAENLNPLLLSPDTPIEALFLLEIPKGGDPTSFYSILEYYAALNVAPVYSVIENPDITEQFLTISLLYSRKPDELLEDYNKMSEQHAKAKVKKSLDQYITLSKLEVNLEKEAKRVTMKNGGSEDDILRVLKRIGKL